MPTLEQTSRKILMGKTHSEIRALAEGLGGKVCTVDGVDFPYSGHFGYKILEVRPLDALVEFADHKRLRVFNHKGTKCLNCGIGATTLALGEDRGGRKHWDLYCLKDGQFIPLTVDHIFPKSLGGSSDLSNLQPLCQPCNKEKGASVEGLPDKSEGEFVRLCDLEEIPLGAILYRCTATKNRHMGVLIGFVKKQNVPFLSYRVFKKDSAKVLWGGEKCNIYVFRFTGGGQIKRRRGKVEYYLKKLNYQLIGG